MLSVFKWKDVSKKLADLTLKFSGRLESYTFPMGAISSGVKVIVRLPSR